MPNIQQCFGHFAPTLRFLALMEPAGSPRQILYFIGLFPNLQDFKLLYILPATGQESAADAELVPCSVPPLRGRLTLACLGGERLMKDMITFFGGLRFHSMDLFRVKCIRLLLDACAETLETLRLYPTDPYGEDLLQKIIRRKRTEAHGRQRRTHPGEDVSICHGTRPFGHLKPPLNRLLLLAMLLPVSLKASSPPLRPLYPPTSLSSTVRQN
jgi:hypothetical protein